MRIKLIIQYLFYLYLIPISFGQNIIKSDPFYIFENENNFQTEKNSLIIRPIYKTNDSTNWSIYYRNEIYYNQNRPILENIGFRRFGKGIGSFFFISFEYSTPNLFISIEPYVSFNQNKHIKPLVRKSPYIDILPDLFNYLNDSDNSVNQNNTLYGIRETNLYLHYNGFGIGLSNANMWWGPGIHSSLTMTNNTTGFPYLMIGTLNELNYKNIGFNFRYIFSQLQKVIGNPYYTALVFSLKFSENPCISMGISRNYLSGGIRSFQSFNSLDAALLPFEQLFIDSKPQDNESGLGPHDYWDQSMAGFATLYFPLSRLKLFIEIGTDDHRQNWMDLRSQPDHNSAIIIGLRKYSLFDNQFLFSGFEYANIKRSYSNKFRSGGYWWWKDFYEYSTYDGRRWAAHSGPDSDDFYLFLGYDNGKYSIIPSFNFERRGIISFDIPEVKIELRFDFRFKINNYVFSIYIEQEYLNNVAFEKNNSLNNNVIWFGFDKKL